MPKTIARRDLLKIAAEQQNSTRRRLTRHDCGILSAAGVLAERFELIDGSIIEKTEKSVPEDITSHLIFSRMLEIFDVGQAGTGMLLEVLAEDRPLNFPMPDVFVLYQSLLLFPGEVCGSDTLLVVEVASDTLRVDLLYKATLYARAGVPEYWVFDVEGLRLFVYRSPLGNAYDDVRIYDLDERVAPQISPKSEIPIAELMPFPVKAIQKRP